MCVVKGADKRVAPPDGNRSGGGTTRLGGTQAHPLCHSLGAGIRSAILNERKRLTSITLFRMLKCEKSSMRTPGIATHALVSGRKSAQGVKPLAPTGAVAPNLPSDQPVTFSIWLVVARLPLADLPKLLVC